MSASVFESPVLNRLFPTGETGRLFTDTAEVRAMLLVEGALARAQGALGIIPQDSADFLHRSAMEVQIDPAGLAQATGSNGVSVPALVAAFRSALEAPEHVQFVHWGATSQDILDTGLMLRMRQALNLIDADIADILATLADLAETHADLPMPARTYGQHATPTSFGAVAAQWGAPLLGLREDLKNLRDRCLLVSLSGAAGTSSALGPKAGEIRAHMAQSLGLTDPERSWHTDRTPVLQIADWLLRLTLTLAKPGEDIIELVESGIGELSLGKGGASSTMPQKQNPVAPSVLVALSRQQTGLTQILHSAAVHRYQRDGAAWFTEWMCLPQIVLGAASAAQVARDLFAKLTPRADAMDAALNGGLGLTHAEAISFALAAHMPRPDAQAEVKRLCTAAMDTATPLADLVARDWPQIAAELDLSSGLGTAPDDARRFAEAARNTG